jgi:hypothetical protein
VYVEELNDGCGVIEKVIFVVKEVKVLKSVQNIYGSIPCLDYLTEENFCVFNKVFDVVNRI